MKLSHSAAVLEAAEQWRAMIDGMKGGLREYYEADMAQRKNGWISGLSVCLRDVDQGRMDEAAMLSAWARIVTRSVVRKQNPCYGAGFRKAVSKCMDDIRKAAVADHTPG